MRINAPRRVYCLMHTTRYIANDKIVFIAVGYPKTTFKKLGCGEMPMPTHRMALRCSS